MRQLPSLQCASNPLLQIDGISLCVVHTTDEHTHARTHACTPSLCTNLYIPGVFLS